MSAVARAEQIIRVVRGTLEASLRVAWLRNLLVQAQYDVSDLACVLEIICARAEQADYCQASCGRFCNRSKLLKTGFHNYII